MNISPKRFADDLRRHAYEFIHDALDRVVHTQMKSAFVDEGTTFARSFSDWSNGFDYKKAESHLEYITSFLLWDKDRPTLEDLLRKWMSSICRAIWEEYLYTAEDRAKEWATPKWWEMFKFPSGFTISEVGEDDEYDIPDHPFPGAEFIIRLDRNFFHLDDS